MELLFYIEINLTKSTVARAGKVDRSSPFSWTSYMATCDFPGIELCSSEPLKEFVFDRANVRRKFQRANFMSR